MAHGTRINGTAYGITGGKCLVGGTTYSIKKGRTLIGGTGYDIAFGTPVGSVPEGHVITIHENGSPIEYFVVKHNYESTENGTGGTLVFRKPSLPELQWDAGESSYYNSSIDSWLNSTFKARLSSGALAALRTTRIKSANSGSWYVNTIEKDVFLPSVTELGASASNAPVEGSVVPVYSSIINNGEFPGAFWTRTNMDNDSYMAYGMREDGTVYEDPKPSTNPIRPMFVLDSNADISNL